MLNNESLTFVKFEYIDLNNNVIVLEYLYFSQKDNNDLQKKQTVNIAIFTSSMGGGIKSNDK